MMGLGLGGGITAVVQFFSANASAGIFRLLNRANAANTQIEESYAVTPDETVDASLTTPTITDMKKLSDDAMATHKIIFPRADLDLKKGDRVSIDSVNYEVESIRKPSTPHSFLTAFAFEMQTGRGNE